MPDTLTPQELAANLRVYETFTAEDGQPAFRYRRLTGEEQASLARIDALTAAVEALPTYNRSVGNYRAAVLAILEPHDD